MSECVFVNLVAGCSGCQILEDEVDEIGLGPFVEFGTFFFALFVFETCAACSHLDNLIR